MCAQVIIIINALQQQMLSPAGALTVLEWRTRERGTSDGAAVLDPAAHFPPNA
jgi:hypothetical protein